MNNIQSPLFPIGSAASYMGFDLSTLKRWDKEGLLVPTRSRTNRRMYSQKQLDEFVPPSHNFARAYKRKPQDSYQQT